MPRTVQARLDERAEHDLAFSGARATATRRYSLSRLALRSSFANHPHDGCIRRRGDPDQDTGHLSDRDIARATGAGVGTVGAWLRRTRSPRGERAERLADLSSIVERLAPGHRSGLHPCWLPKPAPALHDEKPIDLLARGEWRPVARLISGLESPTFS
jgi:hypothetical protein